MVPMQQEHSDFEPRIFRFSPAKHGSSSSSMTGLLSSTQEHSPGQLTARTLSFNHRNKVIIHTIPSSRIGSPPTSLRRKITSSSSLSDASQTNPTPDWSQAEVFLSSGAPVVDANHSGYISRGSSLRSQHRYQHIRSSSLGSAPSYFSRTSSVNDVVTSLSVNQSSLAEAALRAPRISRNSSRRSYGEEWTRHHWHKIKEMEEDSERARRCSKLSSGFAPLMVFGGLVFVCIGVSARTNTGKDSERLKNLSAAPLAMGIFMIAFGTALVITWFACRSRSHKINQRLLHGSRLNLSLPQENLMQTVMGKFHNLNDRRETDRTSRTPSLPGVRLDTSDSGSQKSSDCPVNNRGRTERHQQRTDTLVSRETSV